MSDDDIKNIAIYNFKVRTYGGFGLGIFTAIGGIILLIISIFRKQWDLLGDSIIVIVVGLLLLLICGCFIFKKRKSRKK